MPVIVKQQKVCKYDREIPQSFTVDQPMAPRGETEYQQAYYIKRKYKYSKTSLKRPHKNRQTKALKINDSLMKVKRVAKCSLGAFCNTFDLH